jgi:hypothetical protein
MLTAIIAVLVFVYLGSLSVNLYALHLDTYEAEPGDAPKWVLWALAFVPVYNTWVIWTSAREYQIEKKD